MQKVYDAANALEAQMLVDLLRQEGIEGHVNGAYLQGAIGELPAAGLVRVMVGDEDAQRAREVIERWNSTQDDAGPPPSASTVRVHRWRYLVAGMLVGVAGAYAFVRSPVTVDGIDYDRDGVLDEKWTFAPSGRMLKVESDRNLDGKIDMVTRYDERGLVEFSESDDDFDGVFESRSGYRLGNIQTSTADTDGDGFHDMRWNYSAGVLKTIDYLNPRTGLALKTEFYRLGRMVQAEIDTDQDGTMDRRVTYDAKGEVAKSERIGS